MAPDQDHVISPDQLQVGVYVYLDLSWMNHPFSFNNFKIRTEEQLLTIRRLGLQKVRWDPSRSDVSPLTETELPATESPLVAAEAGITSAPTSVDAALMAAKQVRIQRLAEQRENVARVEAAFTSAVAVAKSLHQTIGSKPEATLIEAGKLMSKLVDELLAAPEVAIQVMSEKPGVDETYYHPLNVSVLSMILGRELRLPADVIKMIGLGAIFHDMGLAELPPHVVSQRESLTKSERELRERHCRYGFELGRKAGLPAAALNVILQHHESFDGGGYPQKLKGESIDVPARLVAIVNVYDNLCNPPNVAQALTPHEALSAMYAQKRNWFDPKLLLVFIRFMGVYPPGTVVALSNDAIGLVIKVNSSRPLKPTLIVYDAEIPKSEALLLDLEDEPDINITRSIKPGLLSPAVFEYLSPRKRVNYYFDTANPKPDA